MLCFCVTEVLTYHVVSGTSYSVGLSDKQKLSTLNSDGQQLTVSIDGGKATTAIVGLVYCVQVLS